MDRIMYRAQNSAVPVSTRMSLRLRALVLKEVMNADIEKPSFPLTLGKRRVT